jgi:molybdenum cofactor synthesis domain-containing protein
MTRQTKVLTVSDRVSHGERHDLSGPDLEQVLTKAGFDIVERRQVPDGLESVASALREMSDGFAGLIVTTGGTGFAPRDNTPEATLSVLEREAPGFGELMRATSPWGALSRARAGVVGRCIIVNTPGSPKGATESITALLDLLPHALDVVTGDGDHHPPETGGTTAISSSDPTG